MTEADLFRQAALMNRLAMLESDIAGARAVIQDLREERGHGSALMRAAPAMFDALQNCIHMLERLFPVEYADDNLRLLIEAGRAALAKAAR